MINRTKFSDFILTINWKVYEKSLVIDGVIADRSRPLMMNDVFISDDPIHHQEQGDGDREPGARRHQSRQDPGRQHRRLEVGAVVRPSPATD